MKKIYFLISLFFSLQAGEFVITDKEEPTAYKNWREKFLSKGRSQEKIFEDEQLEGLRLALVFGINQAFFNGKMYLDDLPLLVENCHHIPSAWAERLTHDLTTDEGFLAFYDPFVTVKIEEEDINSALKEIAKVKSKSNSPSIFYFEELFGAQKKLFNETADSRLWRYEGLIKGSLVITNRELRKEAKKRKLGKK